MPTVYVSNRNAKQNYDAAEAYGPVKFITSGHYSMFKTLRLEEEVIDALIYSTSEDYLVLSGSATVAAICLMIWILMHKRVKLLLYDAKKDAYVERQFDRANIQRHIEQLVDKAARQE